MPYAEAWSLQKRLHADVAEGREPPTLLMLEHPPTITLGTSADRTHLLLSEKAYRDRGIAVHHVERGGQVTYHGPGQLVGYPIVPVVRVGDFLRDLERVIIQVLESFGLAARGNPGYAGVWVGDAKVAALGIAVRKRVSFHGFALNVSTNLDDYQLIVPCGNAEAPMTSLERLLGTAPPMSDVMGRVESAWRENLC